MMIKLQPGQSIKRLVRVFGVEVPVCAEINADGIAFWVQGSRKKTHISWLGIAEASHTPPNVPSFLMGKPLELLRSQAEKLQKET
jgi:hypothetical protein